MECGLRVYYYGSPVHLSGEHAVRVPHPVRGWTLDPGGEAFQRTKDYGVTVRINAKGLRDQPHDYEPEAGVFRIIVLGDSFMEAYQVPLEDSLPYRLQERLGQRRVEVINLGVGGYGTAQQYLYLRDEGLRYRPYVVVMAFFTGNDVQNNSRPLQELLWGADALKAFGRPYAHVGELESDILWELPDSKRLTQVAKRRRQKRARLGYRIVKQIQPAVLFGAFEAAVAAAGLDAPGKRTYEPDALFGWAFRREHGAEDVWDEAWLVTQRLILETQRLAASHGARFALLIVPTNFQVERDSLRDLEAAFPSLDFDSTRINRALARFASSSGVPILDLTDSFVEANEREPASLYHQREDKHWNAQGHELAAAELERFLERQGWLPAQSTNRSK